MLCPSGLFLQGRPTLSVPSINTLVASRYLQSKAKHLSRTLPSSPVGVLPPTLVSPLSVLRGLSPCPWVAPTAECTAWYSAILTMVDLCVCFCICSCLNALTHLAYPVTFCSSFETFSSPGPQVKLVTPSKRPSWPAAGKNGLTALVAAFSSTSRFFAARLCLHHAPSQWLLPA